MMLYMVDTHDDVHGGHTWLWVGKLVRCMGVEYILKILEEVGGEGKGPRRRRVFLAIEAEWSGNQG